MKKTKELKRIFHVQGYGVGESKLLPTIVIAFSVFALFFSAFDLENTWRGGVLTKYVFVLDQNIILSTLAIIAYLLHPEHFLYLNRIALKNYQGYMNSQEHKMVIENCVENQERTLKYIKLILNCLLYSTSFLAPCISIYVIIFSENYEVKDLPLPILFSYPEGYDNLINYTIIYLIQLFILTFGILGNIYIMYGSILVAMQTLVRNLKLFNVSLSKLNVISNCDQFNKEFLQLKKYMNWLIREHQNIYKEVKEVNRCVGFLVTIANQCLCLQMCLYLCCTIEIDNILLKFCFLFFMATESVVLFIYCKHGQDVINQSEELRLALWESSWTDKPQWLKKSLLVMLTMANRPLLIKPHGLYTLNLNTYTNVGAIYPKVMNASYSYFNMMRTFQT